MQVFHFYEICKIFTPFQVRWHPIEMAIPDSGFPCFARWVKEDSRREKSRDGLRVQPLDLWIMDMRSSTQHPAPGKKKAAPLGGRRSGMRGGY